MGPEPRRRRGPGESGVARIDGLATCGKFKGKIDIKDVHKVAVGAGNEHLQSHPSHLSTAHLHFVYWQQTAGITTEKDVFKTTTAPAKPGKAWSGGAHTQLGNLVQELQTMDTIRGVFPSTSSHTTS